MNTLLDALSGVVGAAHVLTAPADMASYCQDWRKRYQGSPLCVVRPGSTREVAEVVRLCAMAGVAMVPQGGNTGLCGGGVPRGGEVLISLARLNRVRAIDTATNTITVEAGCTLAQVQEAARAAQRLFPLSLAAEGSATIGGNLSTNAGGVQVLRYGNTRDLTLGLEVVLPDGRCWDGLRGLRKDNTGYDLKHWFIGAEGTLGLITAAVLKLYPPPRVTSTAWLASSSPASAVALLSRLRQSLGDRVSAFELIGRTALEMVLRHIPGSREPLVGCYPWYVLVELTDTLAVDLVSPLTQALVQATEAGEVLDGAIATSETQAGEFWRLRESISEAQRIEGISIKHDVAVPLSRIVEFIDRADRMLTGRFPGVRIVCFGHVGDGNLHYNLSKPTSLDNSDFIAQTAEVNRAVHDLIHDLGGSISAEHGLGQLKREEIQRYKSPLEMELMMRLKGVIDPHGLMNPGKVL